MSVRQKCGIVEAHEALPRRTTICSRYAANGIEDFARKVDSPLQLSRAHSAGISGRKLPKETSTQRRPQANDSVNYFVYLASINYSTVQLTFPGNLRGPRRGDHRQLVKYEQTRIFSTCNILGRLGYNKISTSWLTGRACRAECKAIVVRNFPQKKKKRKIEEG